MMKQSILLFIFWSYLEVIGDCQFYTSDHRPKKMVGCTALLLTTMFDDLDTIIQVDKLTEDQIGFYMRQIKLDKGIKTLQRKWFRSLVQLKVLSLKEIEINDIEDDAFNDSQFESLEELGFFRTPIQFLREGTFNGLKNLLKLRFSAVNFIGFSKNVLATVPKLTTLIIERCGSKKLMIDNLFGSNPIRNLINLRIIECNLKDTITESTFKSLKGIISLSLSQNRIERIGNRSFDIIFPTLRHLHLGWNGMKSLGGKLFKTRGRQFPIQISANGNPWHCDCELESFRQRIKKTNLKFDNITCLTPPENAGVILNFANSLCVESIRSVDLTHNVSDIGSRLLCEKLNDMRENVPLRLTKDETEIRIRTRNDRLFIDTLHFSNDFNLIGFEERKLRNGEKIQKCLANIKSNNVQSLRFDQELRLNRFYQFCSKRRESNMIAPLNCISFYSGDLPKFADGLMSTDVWIMIDDKSISIIAFVLCPIFAFIIGISSLFFLAKWFMWTFQARDGNLMEKEKASTVHEYEAIKRFRLCDKPLRRRFESTKLDRPINQMSSHMATFQNFDKNYSNAYLSMNDIPPPLPPRNKM